MTAPYGRRIAANIDPRRIYFIVLLSCSLVECDGSFEEV
jgi:hypothetical protein